MKIIIGGGAKNGKSSYAQKLAVRMAGGNKPLYYIATMCPTDEEDELRIRRHIKDREGLNFTTIEKPSNLAELLTAVAEKGPGENSTEGTMPDCYIDRDGVFLLDSVTALLSNVMFPISRKYDIPKEKGANTRGKDFFEAGHEGPSGIATEEALFNERAPEEVAQDLKVFCEAVENVIFVSDYIYSDAREFDYWTETYREGLAYVEKELAEVCRGVVEVSAGMVIWHKGAEEDI